MTKFEEWKKKQSKLDEIAYHEWVEFGNSLYQGEAEIDRLVALQKSRDEKLLNQFPVFKKTWS